MTNKSKKSFTKRNEPTIKYVGELASTSVLADTL